MPTRPQISVRGASYDKLKARAKELGKSVAQLSDEIIQAALAEADKPTGPVDTGAR